MKVLSLLCSGVTIVGLAGAIGCSAENVECNYDTDCPEFCEKCDPQTNRCVDNPDCEDLLEGQCRSDYDCDQVTEICYREDNQEIGECRPRNQGDGEPGQDDGGDSYVPPDRPEADCSAPGLPGQGIDSDSDGWGEYCDCDNHDPKVYPTRPEQIWNCKDDDCDPETRDDDLDDDGYGSQFRFCDPGTDCDDRDPEVYPGAEEICDGKDNDCDGPADEDGVCLDGGFPDGGGDQADAPPCPNLAGNYFVDANCLMINDGEVALTQEGCRVTLSIDGIPCSGMVDAAMNISITCAGLNFNCQGRASLTNSFLLICSEECSFQFNYLSDEQECTHHNHPNCTIDQKVCGVVGNQGVPEYRCINVNHSGRQPAFYCDPDRGIYCMNSLCLDGYCGAICEGTQHCLGFPGTDCQSAAYDDGQGTSGDIMSCVPVMPGETRCSRTPECAPGRICRARPEQDRVILTCQGPLGAAAHGSACSEDAECQSGFCLDSYCSDFCWDDSDCRHDFRCSGATVEDLSGSQRWVAACRHEAGDCGSDADCDATKCCWLTPSLVEDRLESICYYGNLVEPGAPCNGDVDCCTICYDYLGYCLGSCATNDECPTYTGSSCSVDDDCDPGFLCESNQCTRAFSCRNHRFVLREDMTGTPIIDTARICMPARRPCQLDQDCRGGEACKIYYDEQAAFVELQCEVEGPGNGLLGAPCGDHEGRDCRTGMCVVEDDGEEYCSRLCTNNDDCGGYASGYFCVEIKHYVRNGLFDYVPVCVKRD